VTASIFDVDGRPNALNMIMDKFPFICILTIIYTNPRTFVYDAE
jgi:hypothetical protein